MFIFKARMFGYRLSLWIAHRLGRTFYLLKRGWFPPVFWLLVTAFFIWLIDTIRHIANPKADYWFQFWYVLAVFVLLWLLWWAWQGHKRVVIETFMDYTGAAPVSDSQGLATLLVVQLAQLHELYRAVDEQRAISTAANSNQPIDATIKVDDVSDFLTGAVSAQSKLSLGPIEIPVGTLLALLGRFVQGPRIIGSLHKDNDNFILTAQRVGGRPAYSWRVDSVPSACTENGTKKSIDEMIHELACRIFTDLSLSGTVRWKAAKSFSEGLRFYRDCLRTSKERALKLRQAERKFIETLEEDKDFVLAHYNLGVVYMELGQVDDAIETGQLEAAEEAFNEAISHNPGSWIAYYALAVCRYQQEQYDSAYRICLRISERAITQKPGKINIAKIFHMIGLAQMKGLVKSGSYDHQSVTTPSPDELHAAMQSYKKALRQAWHALCSAELLQLGMTETDNLLIPQLEATLSVCMKDLAMAYTHFAESKQQQFQQLPDQAMKYDTYYQKAHELLHLATFLTSSDSQNYAALFDTYTHSYVHVAKMYCERQDYLQAIKEYRAALRINPDDAKFWASFALACASFYL
ncbi:MAG TPA: tetratricopeptide repeat protein [Ktedonobacteraceae bacterium]|nr:tetratricopeptide repeat protein [Ktedonobacteraceae bacterium]